MAGVWEAYRQWVLQGGDSQIRTFSTFSQLLLGYNGDILDYVWKNELFSSALGIVEHVNGEIKRTEEGERVSLPLSIVKMIRIVQRAVEVLLRMYVVGRIHWPWETPRLVKQAIVAIELVKAVLLLYVNKHISHFLRTLRVYCRSLPKGRRTGMRVPLVSEGRHPSLPPVLTVWDVLQPLADAATVVRPLLYSSLLLRYHNSGRPWRALLASLLLEVCVFLVTFIKGKADSEQARLMRKRDQDVSTDVVTSRKLSRQASRFRDYLLRDPIYMEYVESRVAPVTNLLQKVPLFGFFVEYYLLRRHLYFETSGS